MYPGNSLTVCVYVDGTKRLHYFTSVEPVVIYKGKDAMSVHIPL